MSKRTHPAKYAKISTEKRLELIKMVTIDKSQISPAGRKLGIKESTAKLIIKRFRETGTIFEKKYVDSQQIELLEIKNPINSNINSQAWLFQKLEVEKVQAQFSNNFWVFIPCHQQMNYYNLQPTPAYWFSLINQ